MVRTGFFKIGVCALLAMAAVPAMADSRFTIRRMDRRDVPPGRGFCEIRLQVDDTIEVSIDGDQVFSRTLSGQDARDDGSMCTMTLPRRPVEGFNFEVKERRGDIQLVEGPTPRNGGRVIVRIHDGPGGFGRYIFQLTWALEGGGPPPPMDRRPDGDRPDGDRPDRDDRRGIRILTATWGAPGRGRDVTRIVQESMRDGHIHLKAANETMGFDPAVGVVKTLFVAYEIRGRRQEARIPEGAFLDVP